MADSELEQRFFDLSIDMLCVLDFSGPFQRLNAAWEATLGFTRDDARGVIYGVARDITERKRAEEERERLVAELQTALTEVRALQGILPICSYCKRIRDDENYWHAVEAYITEHTNTRFSHGICPSCYTNVVEPELEDDGA